MMSVTTDLKARLDHRNQIHNVIAQLESRFPGWHVWAAGSGSPVATRTGNIKPVNRARWQYTLLCESWQQLERELAEQQDLDDTLQFRYGDTCTSRYPVLLRELTRIINSTRPACGFVLMEPRTTWWLTRNSSPRQWPGARLCEPGMAAMPSSSAQRTRM